MAKEIRVILVEDDFYARGWMEMLLRRDWRTQVVCGVSNPTQLSIALQSLNECHERIDLALIDTEIPCDSSWLAEALTSLAKYHPGTVVLYLGVAPSVQVARLLREPNAAGYLLKDEIRCALPWAVMLASRHQVVITPGVCDAYCSANPLRSNALILDGRLPIAPLTERETEAARLAFILSMERRNLADEMGITEDYSYGLVSTLYEKMGLNDILAGEVSSEPYFGAHPSIQEHLTHILDELHTKDGDTQQKSRGHAKKARDKETLAFHLLTLPDISELPGTR